MIDRRRSLTHADIGDGAALLGCAAGAHRLEQAVAAARFHGDDVLGAREGAALVSVQVHRREPEAP